MSSEGPALRPTQFEDDAIGRVAKSVNMSRGDVNLVKQLVLLPGRPGDATLAVSVAIQGESNVFDQATRWNLDAPTGVLGLGWSLLGDRISCLTKGSLAPASLSYTAQFDGVEQPLVEDDVPWLRASIDSAAATAIEAGVVPGVLVSSLADHGLALSPAAVAAAVPGGWRVTDAAFERVLDVLITAAGADVFDGGRSFQPQDYQFWKIAYYPEFERWEVTTDSGELRVFGGGVSAVGGLKTSAGNSIGWAVKWGEQQGNCTGPSMNTAGQSQFATQWSLSSRSDRWGSTVRYGYNEFARHAGGVLGRNAEQRVGAGGLAYTKAVYPTSVTDLFGRAVTFEYGDKTFTADIQEYLDPHKVLTPAALPETPPPDLTAPNAYQDRYETLYLRSVAVANERAEPLYRVNLSYSAPTAVSTLTGALRITAAKRYLTAVTEENAYGHVLPCYSFGYCTDLSDGPNLGGITTVTYPQGSTAEFTYERRDLPVCQRSIDIAAPAALGADATPFVFYGDDYVVNLWVSNDQFTVTMDAYAWVGRWERWSPAGPVYSSQSAPVDLTSVQAQLNDVSFAVAFAAGEDQTEVLLVARDPDMPAQWSLSASPVTLPGSLAGLAGGSNFVVATVDVELYVFTWDWRTRLWSGTGEAAMTYPAPVSAIAGSEFYLAATSGESQTTLTLSWVDATATWHTGGSVTLGSTPGFNLGQFMCWDAGPSSAAVTFADDPHGISYTAYLVTWDAGYNVSSAAFRQLPAHGIDAANIPWPPTPEVVTPTFAAVRQHLFRFDGGTWQHSAFPALPGTSGGDWLAYAYSQDVAVQALNMGSDVLTTVQSYDPMTARFATFGLTTQLPPSDDVSRLGWPAVAGDYLIARNALFYRGNSTDWGPNGPLASPVAQFPAVARGQRVDSWSFANGAPDYLAYLRGDDDPSQNAVQLLVLENGGLVDPPPAALPATTYTVPSSAWLSAAPGKAPIGPGSFVTFPAASTDFGDAQQFTLFRYAGQALSGPVTAYSVRSLEITDGFGVTHATAYEFDAATAACDPGGTLVKYYRSASYPGASSPGESAFGRTVYSYKNGLTPGSRFAMLDGLLIQTADFSGAMVCQLPWSASYGLPAEPAPPSLVSAALRAALLAGQVHVSAAATVAAVVLDGTYAYWSLADGGTGYCLDWTGSTTDPDGLRVFDGGAAASTTTAWEVFSGHPATPIHGGYARPVTVTGRKDGVASTVSYSYLPRNGAIATKQWSLFNGAGLAERHVQTTTYGSEIYPELAAANLLAPVVALRQTIDAGGEPTTSSSSATTWQGWRQAGGAALAVPAPAQNWYWRGDVTGRDRGEFPFGAAPDPSRWSLVSTVTAVSDSGLVLESADAAGVTHSTLFDVQGQVPVALLSNGSFAARQALVAGFESYEDQARWTVSGGASVDGTQAHTGSASLCLPPGAASSVAPLTPDASRPSIFSAWYRTGAGFTAAAGSGWSLTLESGDVVTVPFQPTGGRWRYQSAAVPPTASVTISAANHASAAVNVDDVMLVPLTAKFTARVYDDRFTLPSARLDQGGHVWRTYRDTFMRHIGGSAATDVPCSLQLHYVSATGNAGGFSAADPNAAIAVKAFDGGSHQQLADWLVEPPGAISAAGSLLVHGGTTRATLESTLILSEFALYFEIIPLNDGPLTLTDDVSVKAGSVAVTLSARTGQWSIGDGTFIGPLRSCLVAQTGGQLMLWANERLIGSVAPVSHVPVSDAPVSLDLGANALGIANLTLLRSPALRVSYRDATGAAVQEHVVTAEGYFVQQTIRDAQSIPVVTTKPAPGGFGSGASYPVPAFRPGFVEVADFLSELDASGAMRGDVSDWYDGTNDTDDGGYPYRRVAFERSPLRRAVEYGLPGAAYAIVNRSTTSPVERATVQCSYGPNTATSVPYLDLPPQSYGVATTVTPSKLPTSTISDASDADIARLTPNLGASFLSSASNSYENGDQTRVTAQPNSFVLDEPGEAETRRSNALRQLNYQCSPDAGESRYLYDRAGRVRFVQDARGAVDGIVVYLLWDALGRKVARGIVTFDWSAATEAELQEHAEDCAWPESSSVVTYQRQRGWAWDGDGSDPNAVGHMVGDLAVTGETEVAQRLCWNAAGLLEEKRVTISDPAARAEYATSFGYDVQGRLLTVGYPQLPGLGFAAVHYRYDGRDNVLSIRDDQGTSFAEYGYDPAGKAVSVDYRCGLIAGTQQHDPLGRQTTLALRAADGALTSSLGYNADGYLSGRVETLTPPLTGFDGNEVFRYDTLGRLESSTDTAGVKSIALSFKTPSGVIDQNGNLQSITRHAGASLSLDYVPGTNRVAGQAAGQRAGGASSAYAYYANGALRQRGSDLALSYVPGGLLPSTITAAGVELAFAYDSDGERVGKRVNGGPLTADVHAGFLGPIVIDSGGAAQALVYGPRGVVALASGGERYCVWSDHLGSPRVAWDGNGRVVAAYAYDAYGARVAANEPKAGFMPLGFTGRQLDHETGLYNFRTRLYDPVTGRFLAPDPAAQFPSAYCYAGNVPTMMTDPDGQMTAGLEALLDFGLLVLMIVGVAFTGGATTAVAAPLLELGTTIGTAQAVAAGMAIGAVGMGVSSAAFEGLYYGLTTPPGNWQWSRFGKDVAAAAIGGAVGGVVTGGLNVWVDWLTPLVTAPEAGEDIEMDVMGGVENAADAGADEPAPAQTTAQRAALLATRTVARGAAGAAGGALKGYVHKGMSNVFDNQDFNANVGESVLTGFGLGFAFGALGGGLSAAKDLDMIDMSGLTSAFSRTPQMFVMFGLMIGVSLYMVLYRRSATIQPSHSGGTT